MTLPDALSLAADGYRVFPLVYGDKRPATPNGFKDAVTDPDDVARLFGTARRNVGIATGYGLTVVDVDTYKGGVLPDGLPTTRVIRTGSGGTQHYYRTPVDADIRNSTAVVAPGVDIRSDGGYVVGPGSHLFAVNSKVGRDGDYIIEDDEPIADMPAEWIERCKATNASNSNGERAAFHKHDGQSVPMGEQEATINSRACSYRAHGELSQAAATAAIWADVQTWQQDARNPWTLDDIERKVESAWRGITPLGVITHGKRDARDAAADVPRHSFKLAADIEPQNVDWLWEPWLPYGMLTMLDGDPGIGKSFLALEIAARISVGSPMPPVEIQPDVNARHGVVLVMPEDDNAKTIVPRLIALGADLTRIVIISKMFDASNDDGIAWLEEAADTVNAQLIVFDPLLTYLGGERSDTHKDRDVRRSLDPIIELAIRRRIAILGNRHLSKGSLDSSALYRGMGSIGIVAVARVSWIVARNPEEGKGGNVLAVSKCNLAPKPKSLTWMIEPVEGKQKNLARVTWTGDTMLDADQLATGPKRKTAPSLQGDVEDAINLYLVEHDGSAPNAEMLQYLHETHGWSEAVIMKWRARMDNLENEFVKGKVGAGTIWRFRDGMQP